jgi:DNA (cytosine-5)-methyltransferase 1
MAHAVRVVRPTYAIVENVAALLSRGMGTVLGDLAESGYDADWCCVPTGRRMGHERERVFIVADALREGLQIGGGAESDGVDAARIVAGQRPASFLEAVDPAQKWADRPLLGRGVHGIPDRVDRVRSLGNSIVPQIAEWIGRRILDAEANMRHRTLDAGRLDPASDPHVDDSGKLSTRVEGL